MTLLCMCVSVFLLWKHEFSRQLHVGGTVQQRTGSSKLCLRERKIKRGSFDLKVTSDLCLTSEQKCPDD